MTFWLISSCQGKTFLSIIRIFLSSSFKLLNIHKSSRGPCQVWVSCLHVPPFHSRFAKMQHFYLLNEEHSRTVQKSQNIIIWVSQSHLKELLLSLQHVQCVNYSLFLMLSPKWPRIDSRLGLVIGPRKLWCILPYYILEGILKFFLPNLSKLCLFCPKLHS